MISGDSEEAANGLEQFGNSQTQVADLSCAEMFRSPQQHTHLFQIVFSKGNVKAQGYPMSRDFLYEQPVTDDVRRVVNNSVRG